MSEQVTRRATHLVTVVPHTHWDREWYQPFAVFQARLVETVDRVLDLLESDESFTHFMLDGQAVVLEDFLALRPDAEERIRRLVTSGRLAIGPWYTLADEFLSSPEALVRNLQIGGEVCRRFGEPMPVVYTPDSFGHISQLPLLAHGFGFDSLVFERGVGDEGEELGGEFRWRAADGASSVLAVHLLTTYSSGAGLGYQDWSRYRDFDADRAVAHASKALYGGSQRIGMEPWLDESLGRIQGGSSAYAGVSQLLLLNGSDHLPPQEDLPAVVDLLGRRLPEARFRMGRLREYIDGVLAEAADLPEYRGEFRGSRYHHLLSGVFSSRLYLKQANHAAQQRLERYAEPLSALAHLAGAPYPAAVLNGAWKELLRNHCHDSICGCSVDQVHDAMMPRFAGVLASADYLSRKALAHLSSGDWSVAPSPTIAGRLTPPAGQHPPGEAPLLAAFNPQPRAWRGVLSAVLPVPRGYLANGLGDSQGRPVPSELEPFGASAPGDVETVESLVRVSWLAELEPLSVSCFRLLTGSPEETSPPGPAAGTDPKRATAAATAGVDAGDSARVAAAPSVARGAATSGAVLENEHLRAEIGADGLQITHKPSGRRVRALLSLEDVGDAGDEYDFSPVAGDRPRILRLDRFEVTREGNGMLAATMRASGELDLPKRLSEDRQRREGASEIPFELDLSLATADPYVRLDLRLSNSAEDHRLRLRVDTDVISDRVVAEGHFDVLERPIAAPRAEGWFQKPSDGNHQRRFLVVGDGDRGLVLFNAGLPEYAAQRLPDGVRLAVTLLRCIGWLSRNDLSSRPEGAGPALPTPAAQCPGLHRFELALMPFAGRWQEAGVAAAADRFTTPPLIEAVAGEAPGLPELELPEGLLLSALKMAAAGQELIVRFWNPGDRQVSGPLRLAREPLAVRQVDLAESPQRELPAEAEVPLSVAAKEVVTLAIRFGGDAMA